MTIERFLQKWLVVCLVSILAGCSVKPPVVIPAENENRPVSKPTPEKKAYIPETRSNTAYPSPAAKQLMDKAQGSADSGDQNGAMRYLERAQRISPRAPEIYLQMAQVRKTLGQTGQARQLANKALSLVGDDMNLQRDTEQFIESL